MFKAPRDSPRTKDETERQGSRRSEPSGICWCCRTVLGPRSRQSDGALGAASPQASAAMDSRLAWGPARPTADVRSCSLGWELAPRRRADTGELVGLFR